jgi:uncharacterized membrane protein
MTDAAMTTGREFRIGPIFSRAWHIYAANFIVLTLVAIVISLPNLLSGEGQTPAVIARNVVVFIFWMIVNTVGLAVILYAAFQAMRGRPVQITDAIRRGLSRFWSIVGLAILQWLGISIGFLLLVIPGIMLFIRWSAALPACVVEGLGPLASMKRSAELTKGNRWKIFGMYVLVWLVGIVLIAIIGGIIFGLIGAASVAGLSRGFGVGSVISLVLSAVLTAYINVLLVMVYHDLRVAKEGVDTEQIAAVFD